MDEPWVLPPRQLVGSFLGEAFRAQAWIFPIAVVAFAYEVRVSLLATNRYLAILPNLRCGFRHTSTYQDGAR